MSKNEISKNFKEQVVSLEQLLVDNCNNENIITSGKKKSIVSDSEKIPINHFFMQGVYVREMKMFKGTAVIGAIHKHKHMCFLLSGILTVTDENGTKDYNAPCYIISSPGVKRVLYAHEDSVWYNVHENPSNTNNTKQIEENLVALSYKEYEEYINKKK